MITTIIILISIGLCLKIMNEKRRHTRETRLFRNNLHAADREAHKLMEKYLADMMENGYDEIKSMRFKNQINHLF